VIIPTTAVALKRSATSTKAACAAWRFTFCRRAEALGCQYEGRLRGLIESICS
jgi:hypothetical protein